mgnify:FL=1
MPDPAQAPVDLEHLSDQELLALLIGSAPAKRLLKAVEGELARLARYSLPELEAEGLSPKAAKHLLAALVAGRRVSGTPLRRGVLVERSVDAYRVLKPLMAHLPREKFVALLLDSKNKLISARVISTGTLAATMVPPRDLFAPALREHAATILVAHNHPSGSLVPSDEDMALTRRLVAAGNSLGVKVVDHLIITDEDYMSLRETEPGLWP